MIFRFFFLSARAMRIGGSVISYCQCYISVPVWPAGELKADRDSVCTGSMGIQDFCFVDLGFGVYGWGCAVLCCAIIPGFRVGGVARRGEGCV